MTVCDSKRGCGTGGGMDLRGRKENEEPGEEGRDWRGAVPSFLRLCIALSLSGMASDGVLIWADQGRLYKRGDQECVLWQTKKWRR